MKDAGELQVISSPRVSSEAACDTRARVWAYVFDCYTRKKAAPPSGPDARKETSNDSGKSIVR